MGFFFGVWGGKGVWKGNGGVGMEMWFLGGGGGGGGGEMV